MVENKKKKKRTAISKDETPEQRTERLANFRVSRAVKDILAVSRLAGTGYTLTEPQKVEMLSALKASVTTVSNAFSGQAAAATGFKLSK